MTGPSPFAVLEDAFRLLGTQPHPLSLDSRQLGYQLPHRQIPIVELRSILTRPTTTSDLQDDVIELVLDRMQDQRATWIVVLGGLLLPGLRRLRDQLITSDQRLPSDIEAELLTRLLAATRRPPRDARRFAMHLLRLAQASQAKDRRLDRICEPADRHT